MLYKTLLLFPTPNGVCEFQVFLNLVNAWVSLLQFRQYHCG